MICRMKHEVASHKNDPNVLPLHNRIHVLIMHEDSVIAAGLNAILSGHCNMRVTRRAFAHTSQDQLNADVIVASTKVGVDCLEWIARAVKTANHPVPRVLIVASEAREADVWRAFSAGASGYLRLGCEPEDVAEAVRSVDRGGRYLCAAAARSVAEGITHAALTTRESEVLDLIAVGQSNKVIARGLGIELGTVKAHVKAIFAKLKAATRTEASAIAIQRGLVGRQIAPRYDYLQAGPAMSRPLLHRTGT